MLLAGGAVAIVLSLVSGFTGDPQQGEGWGGGVIEAVFVGVPLVVIGLGLRSRRRDISRRTAVGAGVLAVLVGFVLVMQLLDPNETTASRLVNVVGLVAYGAAVVVELPAFRGPRGTDEIPADRLPPDDPPASPEEAERCRP